MAPRPLVIGHRGASGYRPEHTRASFQLAIALGADAVEPDLVATRDGVLVVRHENEISGTTDVARHPEFAERKTVKQIDGARISGWFTEDFTWDELSGLRAVERLPQLRPGSASFDGRYPILRLSDLLDLLDEARDVRPELALVAELKHATYFAGIGLPLDELVAAELVGRTTPETLVIESFEQTVLGRVRNLGLEARYIYLLEAAGTAADLVAASGSDAPDYTAQLADASLARLAEEVDGISVDKGRLADTVHGVAVATDLVPRAHAAGLEVFTWTLRPENRFLMPPFRSGAARDWGDWRGEYEFVLGQGVDGVFADHPDLALAARDGT